MPSSKEQPDEKLKVIVDKDGVFLRLELGNRELDPEKDYEMYEEQSNTQEAAADSDPQSDGSSEPQNEEGDKVDEPTDAAEEPVNQKKNNGGTPEAPVVSETQPVSTICEACQGTGLKDAQTLCPECSGSGSKKVE